MVLKNGNDQDGNSFWRLWMKNAYFSSFVEVGFALLISNAAIFISLFVYILVRDGAGSPPLFLEVLRGSIRTTEIVVYILGFLAPAMWIMVSNLRAWRHVGFLLVLLILQVVVVFSTGLIFAFSIAKVLMNDEVATRWSLCCLAAALLVWYCTLVYDKKVLKNLENKIEKPRRGKESGANVLADLRADNG